MISFHHLIFIATAVISVSGTQKIEYVTHNRSVGEVFDDNKSVLRFSEASGPGLAWVKGLEFSWGTIEFDAKGRDVLQKSFIGIAFHGKDNENYETVYFRPFNFQAADPVRKIHAVQYTFVPDFDFQQLRDTRKDEFESAIKPADLKAGDWFHVKVEIGAGRVKAFVNGNTEPCLDVATLNPKPAGKQIGFWVGNNSNGDFANFKVMTQGIER